jgi:RNA polymerase sigma-70 factor (ECF subfamily)
MLTQEEDQQLVERVQRGDKRAFDLLVLKYQHKILGLIVRFVHDTHEAQDVAQEAFIKAYRALGNFRGDSARLGLFAKVLPLQASFRHALIWHTRKTQRGQRRLRE